MEQLCDTLQRQNFYPRPPRGGRPSFVTRSSEVQRISIHALREEGDHAIGALVASSFAFLSTPSARRATFAVEMLVRQAS